MLRIQRRRYRVKFWIKNYPPASVSSHLTRQIEMDTQQHIPTLATPVEPVVDNHFEIPAEDTSKISTESPSHDKLPGLAEESENRPHELLPEDTVPIAADVTNAEESAQLERSGRFTSRWVIVTGAKDYKT